nr:MAG TPA: hypothetical protein [Caudoviricetes sp.]
MTDKKLTDEEIIERLERCVKRGNRNHDTDIVLDLINRQKSEIERLKECPKCVYECVGEITEYCVQGPCPNFKTVEQIKTEAYKEFAMKLQAFCKRIIAQKWNEKAAPISWSYAYADFIDDIDNLLIEMVGEIK